MPVSDPLGKHSIQSSRYVVRNFISKDKLLYSLTFREEFQWVKYLEQSYPDILHGFNTKTKLPRFCNAIPDAISYEAQ